MNDADFYRLHLDAYTPATIPMARLAAYMAALADLLGEVKSVHFQGMEPGSTQLVCSVEREAAYGVALRIVDAPSADAKTPEGRAYRAIKHLLLEDSAEARLSRNAQNILYFPRVIPQESPSLGPFWQSISHAGVLMGIGGRDATAHAVLQNMEGTHWRFSVDRALAKRLVGYLYGQPIRLIGEGRRFRDEEGVWQERDLRATHFEVLNDAGWLESIRVLREAVGEWPKDAMETLLALREDD